MKQTEIFTYATCSYLFYVCLVFSPVMKGNYAPVFFVGGLNGYVIVEAYQIVQKKIASHGFVVIGVDYKFPVLRNSSLKHEEGLGQDLNKFFDELTWVC